MRAPLVDDQKKLESEIADADMKAEECKRMLRELRASALAKNDGVCPKCGRGGDGEEG